MFAGAPNSRPPRAPLHAPSSQLPAPSAVPKQHTRSPPPRSPSSEGNLAAAAFQLTLQTRNGGLGERGGWRGKKNKQHIGSWAKPPASSGAVKFQDPPPPQIQERGEGRLRHTLPVPASPLAPIRALHPPTPAPGGWPALTPCALTARGVGPAGGMSVGCTESGALVHRLPARPRAGGGCVLCRRRLSAPSSCPSGLGVVAGPTFAGPGAHCFPPMALLTSSTLYSCPWSPVATVSLLFPARTA